MSTGYYDRQGNPIATYMDAVGDRRVDKTTVKDGVDVSTVHLVMDHGFGGPPLIFETMVFGGDQNQWQARYSTEAEAQAGHDAVVAWLKGDGPEPA